MVFHTLESLASRIRVNRGLDLVSTTKVGRRAGDAYHSTDPPSDWESGSLTQCRLSLCARAYFRGATDDIPSPSFRGHPITRIQFRGVDPV